MAIYLFLRTKSMDRRANARDDGCLTEYSFVDTFLELKFILATKLGIEARGRLVHIL